MIKQIVILINLVLYALQGLASEDEQKTQEDEQTKQAETKPESEPRKPLSEIIAELATRRSSEQELADFEKIDALNDNDYCFLNPNWLVLGRTETEQTVTVELVARAHPEQHLKRDWLAGEAVMNWPLEALPVEDGAVYLLSINHDPHNLTLHHVSTDPRQSGNVNEFYTHHCWRQLQIMHENIP